MPELPVSCKEITKDYMAMSDDIFGWFSETYEKGNELEDLIYIDTIYKSIIDSKTYSQMTKKEQRDLTAKKFNEKVEKNIFLRNNYKKRKSTFNGNQLSKPALIGYKLRPRKVFDRDGNEMTEEDQDSENEELSEDDFKEHKTLLKLNENIYEVSRGIYSCM
jgi:hypothetical protein